MKILGISLGHDSNFSLIDNGEIISVYEAERYYRQKRYKLQALNPGEEKISGYQIVKYSDLVETLTYLKNNWGSDFDFIAVQNQGREDEFQRLRLILNKVGIKFKNIENFAHHLSHASLAYFTSPFDKSIIFSYDGAGNDGQTLLFTATGNEINYFKNFHIRFGQAYNNLGYIMGLKPDVVGSTAGKLMGLTSYGEVREDWKEHCRNYIRNYKKITSIFKNNKKIDYGKNHKINSIGLNNIREFNSYLYPNFLFSNFFAKLGLIKQHLKLNDLKNKDFQDLCKTFQIVWSEEVIKILKT
jgi:carbamoyltransferase